MLNVQTEKINSLTLLKTIANIDLVSCSTKELDTILSDLDIDGAQKSPKNVKIMLIETTVSDRLKSEVIEELKKTSKQVDSKKTSSTDQNVAKWRLLFSKKLERGDFLDISSDNKATGQKIRTVRFTVGKLDHVDGGISLKSLTWYGSTDLASSYSTGSHIISFGCKTTVKPVGNAVVYNGKKIVAGHDYYENQWQIDLEFFDTIEKLDKSLQVKKTGKRSKMITDSKMPTDETMSIISENFDLSASEIFKLVLSQYDDKAEKTDVSEETDV